MPTDPRVDQYIAKAPEFAKPILTELRRVIHQGCPEVEEDMKWSRPAFLYRNKIIFGLAAFKAHCGLFSFRQEVNAIIGSRKEVKDSAGSLGRLTQISDLPSKRMLLQQVEDAVRILDRMRTGPTPIKRASSPKPEAVVPDDLAAALAANKAAGSAFSAFSPSHRREYIEWITEAKREVTRQKRIATALEWLVEGKSRNWKYANC